MMRSTGAAAIVKVTGTLSGLFVAPAEVMMTLPLYVPVASPVISTETLAEEGAVPEVGEIDSQLWLEDADHTSVPAPVLLMVSVWLGGFGPPCVALKVIEVGDSPMVGETGVALAL